MTILIAFLLVATMTGAGCSNHNEDGVCFSFDQRQCAGDEWAALLSQFDDWNDRTEALKDYLEGKGVKISKITVEPFFYDVVCEACFVCPETHRFFITTIEESKETLNSLDLLNLKQEDCP